MGLRCGRGWPPLHTGPRCRSAASTLGLALQMEGQLHLVAVPSQPSGKPSASAAGEGEARREEPLWRDPAAWHRNRTQAHRSRLSTAASGPLCLGPEGRGWLQAAGPGGRTLHGGVLGLVPCASRPWELGGPWSAEPRTRRCLQAGSCCTGSTSLDSYGVKFVTSCLKEQAAEWGDGAFI